MNTGNTCTVNSIEEAYAFAERNECPNRFGFIQIGVFNLSTYIYGQIAITQRLINIDESCAAKEIKRMSNGINRMIQQVYN